MNDPDRISSALHDLGYDRKWLDYGFLTEDQLIRQHDDYLTGDEYCRSTEHLRLRAFWSWLSIRVILRDNEVERLIELVALDADSGGMVEDVLRHVLDDPNLTDEQFDRVAEFMSSRPHPCDRVLAIARLQRRFLRAEIDDELVLEAIRSGDSTQQNLLLDFHFQYPIATSALQELKEAGASKAVRNRASQCLATARRNNPR